MDCSKNSVTGGELAILASVVAVLLAKNLNQDQIEVVAAFLSAVSSAMATIIVQDEAIKTENENEKKKNEIKQQICELKKQLKDLGC
ncbi:hypothetical protein [Clostridium oryzae]|uniref:Uncharacterized protein n=1 Tax=Clostridium oryzae TaxID=1450648 RepID=A0A1V4IRT1_9CLOT|nr:hypothetical protein [Clostridium oryzae]OPJ62741.1 hypothetical protein CLORY_16210 [Clostridium oryzae]